MLVNKTRDDADDFGGGASEEMTAAQTANYLNADPRHAVVLSTPHGPRYVIRGAGEGHNDFYWGDMPAEDPNDAAGGDLTAAEAIEAAQTEE